ncbi:MAG: hypothetical protein WCE75_03700 [Terracidiphilus sp.]
MNREPLDRILAGEEELAPSSGFAASVMGRVREESVAPPPIPFPWKRALPGILLASGVLVWALVEFLRMGAAGLATVSFQAPHVTLAALRSAGEKAPAVAAVATAVLACLLVRRLVGRQRLL